VVVECVGLPGASLSTHVILLLGQIAFASLPVVGRLALADIPAGLIPLVRTVGGAIVFSLIAWRRGTFVWPRGDVGFIVLCALLGNVLNQELFIHGLARSTATNAVVIGSTIPVFTLLTALVLRRERARLHRVLGMAVAFAGVAVLVGADELSTDSDHFVGSVMILANALAYGSYLVIGKPLAEKYDPVAVLAYMFIAGTPMVAPIGIAALANAAPMDGGDVAFLAFLIAVPTVAAYGLVQTGLKRAESSLVAAYIYLQPVFAAVGAVFVLDEHIGPRTIACGVIVLFGVWLAARSRA
jgi:drug/metabolite transporter (DMT)-like permease